MIKDLPLKHVFTSIYPIEDEMGNITGIGLSFKELSGDHIYKDSKGRPVRVFPGDLTLEFESRQFYKFASLLLEPVSSYIYKIRSTVTDRDLVENVPTHGKYRLKMKVSRFFFREKGQGRYKILLTVIDEEGNDIVIPLTKRDVLLLLEITKHIFSKYSKTPGLMVPMKYIDPETKEEVANVNGYIMKLNESLLIDQVWLHGQEISSLLYVAHDLVHHLHIENDFRPIYMNYRQVKVFSEKSIAYIGVKKLNKDQEEVPMEFSGRKVEIVVPISRMVLAVLYFSLDMKILEIPKMADSEVLGRIYGEIAGEQVNYRLSMKESTVGIAVKYNPKKDNYKVFLVGEVQDGVYQSEYDDGTIVPNIVTVTDKDGWKSRIDVLTSFKVPLKDAWPRLVRGLSLAFTHEYKETKEKNKMTTNIHSFLSEPGIGFVKYEILIQSSLENKMTVFSVNKYKVNGKDDYTLLASYRQPMNRRQVFIMLMIVLQAAYEMEHVEFKETRSSKDLLPYTFKSFKTVTKKIRGKQIEFGMQRLDNGDVIFGSLEEEDLHEVLPKEDVILTNISSKYRILNARWLPFVGEKIAIGQDGYLTSLFGEINIEEEGGLDWAAKLFFGTAVKE